MAWYSFGRGELGSLGQPLDRRKFAHIYEPTPRPIAVQVERLSAGFAHCVAWQDTKCFAWGLNGECQLGVCDPGGQNARTIIEQPAPVIGLPADERVTQVAAGRIMTLVLTRHDDSKKQRLFLFGHIDQDFDPGEHDMREIPLPDDLEVSQVHCLNRSVLLRAVSERVWELKHGVPLRPFPGVTHVSKLCTGANHVLAICQYRMLYSWGNGAFGQLGQGTCKNCPAPVPVHWENPATAQEKPPRIKLIACGENFSLCCTLHGKVFSWGSNEFNQLGNEVLHGVSTPRPLQVPMPDIDSIQAGRYHACLLSKGKLYTWGLGSYGQLGYNLEQQLGADVPFGEASCPSMRTQKFPRLVLGPWHKVVEVQCGAYQTFVKGVGSVAVEDGAKRHSMLKRLSSLAIPPEDEVLWPTQSKKLRDATNVTSAWNVLQETRSAWTNIVSSVTGLFIPERKHFRMRSQRASLNKPQILLKEAKNTVVAKQIAYHVHPLERPPSTKPKQKRRALERVREFAMFPFLWDGWDETVDRILSEKRHSLTEFLSPEEVTEWSMLAKIQAKGFIGPFCEIIRSSVTSPVPVARKEKLYIYAAPGVECFYDPPLVARCGDADHGPRVDVATDHGSRVKRKLQKQITIEDIKIPRCSAPSAPSMHSDLSRLSFDPSSPNSLIVGTRPVSPTAPRDNTAGNVNDVSSHHKVREAHIIISNSPANSGAWMSPGLRRYSASAPVVWSQEDDGVQTMWTYDKSEGRTCGALSVLDARFSASSSPRHTSNVGPHAHSPASRARPQVSGMAHDGRDTETQHEDPVLTSLWRKTQDKDPSSTGFSRECQQDPLLTGLSRESQEEDASPSGLSRESQQEDPIPSGLWRERQPEDPLLTGFSRESQQEDPIPTGLSRESQQEDPIPSGFSRESRQEDPIPTGLRRERQPEDPIPTCFSRESQQEDPIPTGFSRESQQEDPLLSGLWRERQPEDPIPTGFSRESQRENPILTGFSRESQQEDPLPTGLWRENQEKYAIPTGLSKDSQQEDPVPTGFSRESQQEDPLLSGLWRENQEKDPSPSGLSKDSQQEDPIPTGFSRESQQEDPLLTGLWRENQEKYAIATGLSKDSQQEDPLSTGFSRESQQEDPLPTGLWRENQEKDPSPSGLSKDSQQEDPQLTGLSPQGKDARRRGQSGTVRDRRSEEQNGRVI